MKIAFLKGGTSVWAVLIRLYEGGPYSHCELVFSDGMCGSALYPGGVLFRKRTMEEGRWDYIDLPAHLEPAARAWFETYKGKSYDYVGILRFLLSFLEPSRDKWICTRACADALGIEGGAYVGPNGLEELIRKWVGHV